jgi:hypothetical protein
MKFKLPWLLMLAALCLPMLANAQTDALQRTEKGDVVLPSGNLGIGTTDPRAKLEVQGRLMISGEQGKLIFPDGTIQHTAGVSGQGGESASFRKLQIEELQIGENSLHMGYCPSFIPSTFEPTPPSHPASFIYSTDGPLLINSRETFLNHSNCQIDGVNNQDVYINSNPSTGRVGIGLYLDSPPTHKLHVAGQTRIEELLNSIAANKLVIANSQGVLGSRDFTGNVNDVLRGDGTWGNVPSGNDNWGDQVVETDQTLAGEGTLANPLGIAPQGATPGQVLTWNGTTWLPQNNSPDDDWDYTTNTPNMFAIPSGNVGIGTNLPTAKTHVVSSGAVSGPISTGLIVQNQQTGSGNKAGLTVESTGIFSSGSNTGLNVNVQNGTSQTGVFTNLNTQAILKVGNNTNLSGGSSTLSIGQVIGVSDNTQIKLGLFVNLTGTPGTQINAAAVFQGGGVGIGIINPARELHVVGTTRISTLASGPAGALVRSDANGDLAITNFPGDANQVLRGDGTFGPAASAGWLLTGNTGTNPAVNFIGTTDNRDWVVRTNNTERMRVLATGQVGIGVVRPTAFVHVLNNTTNIGMFVQNNSNNTGMLVQNTAPSSSAMVVQQTNGASTQPAVVVADNSSAFRPSLNVDRTNSGTVALFKNGNLGVVGIGAFDAMLRSDASTSALRSGDFGGGTGLWVSNTGTGANALNVSGRGVAIGNTYGTIPLIAPANGMIVEGNVCIGRTTAQPVAGLIPVGGGPPATAGAPAILSVNGRTFSSGGFFQFSDERFKKNFEPIPGARSLLAKLSPVSYEYDTTVYINSLGYITYTWDSTCTKPFCSEGRTLGFKAQQVKQWLPEVIAGNETTGWVMNYDAMIPVLVQAINEIETDTILNNRWNQVEKKNKQLESEVIDLRQRLNRLETALIKCCERGNGKSIGMYDATPNGTIQNQSQKDVPILEQNMPNPFKERSIIQYYIPESTNKALIMVISTNGTIVLKETITMTGYGELVIEGSTLSPGTYIYQLIVNGEPVDSKRMVITN